MATGNAKTFELKIGKTGVIIIVAGMAALLCASFLFGVDVGKNIDTYPDKIAALPQKALALVWRPAKIKVVPSVPDSKTGQNKPATIQEPATAQAGENIDLTYYNTLTSKKGSPKVESSLEKQPLVAQQKNEEEALKGKFHIETPKQPVTANDKNIEKEAPIEKKAVLDTASNKRKFVVQAASLKEKAKANQVNKKIAALGFKSEIVKVKIKGKGIVFRVMATGFDDKVQAEEAAKKISSKTETNCIVKSIDNTTNKN